jgi:hypothetical protein
MNIKKKILKNSIIEFIVEEKKEKIAKFRKQVLTYLRENADIK